MSNQWGCFGLFAGSLAGLFMAIFLATLLRPVAPPPSNQPATIPPDITIFLSEQSLSRIASETLDRPTVINFDVNGQMEVSTETNIAGLKPVIHVGLLLDMQGTEVVSRLRWVRLGFITIPAGWLSPGIREMIAVAGQAIQSQTPPDFTLIGLTTNPDGVNFQLKWISE